MKFWPTVLVVSAPMLLGGATGLLTGQTGADSTVVAALLPVVLTGVGGALLAFKLKMDNSDWKPDFLIACGAVVAFSTALLIGLYAALFINAYAGYSEWRESLEGRIEARKIERRLDAENLDFRRRALEECSRNEALVNAGRKVLGLGPLPWRAFCDVGQLNSQPVGEPETG